MLASDLGLYFTLRISNFHSITLKIATQDLALIS